MSVNEKMTAIADAIRSKTGGSKTLTLDEMAEAINGLTVSGGIDTSDATATAGDIAKDKTAYVNGEKVEGALPEYEDAENVDVSFGSMSGGEIFQFKGTIREDAILRKGAHVIQFATSTLFGDATAADVARGKTFTSAAGLKVTGTYEGGTAAEVEQATPEITVSTSGLITASATQEAGKVAAGTKSATKQLTAKAAATITPGTTDQSIASGTYLTGKQTIKGDSNLVAGNIKKGVSIFGITGTLEASAGNSAQGSVTIEESCKSFTIDTKLSNIETVVIARSELPEKENGTWGWVISPAGDITTYFSYGTYSSSKVGLPSKSATVDESGVITAKQYSSTYPIVAGTYNWVAYGS